MLEEINMGGNEDSLKKPDYSLDVTLAIKDIITTRVI